MGDVLAGQSNVPPVIIKRVKKVANAGHHGGAWKVAYADFVTAMMAFFLLMWLLNATTEKQRKGLSDYFNPTIAMNRISAGGEGALAGESLLSNEIRARTGTGGLDVKREGDGTDLREAQDAEMEELAKAVDSALFGRGGESFLMEQMQRHVITRLTDEGLVIEIFDVEGASLFQRQSSKPEGRTVPLLNSIAKALNITANSMAINGHMHRLPITLIENPLWQVSSERAQVTRQLLEEAGVKPMRFQRITGSADRKPVAKDPAALRNNRIEIILLRSRP